MIILIFKVNINYIDYYFYIDILIKEFIYIKLFKWKFIYYLKINKKIFHFNFFNKLFIF